MSPRKQRLETRALVLHESGHAIACVSFGVPLDVIEMNYTDVSGKVYYGAKHQRLSIEKRTIIALAGLAAERFFQDDPGVVYYTRKIHKNLDKVYGPKEFKGVDCKDGECDLAYVHEIMPSRIRVYRDKQGKDKQEKWCNDHLKAAWDILHKNEEAFLQLAEALRPRSRQRFGERTNSFINEWEFRPSALQHILSKVKQRS